MEADTEEARGESEWLLRGHDRQASGSKQVGTLLDPLAGRLSIAVFVPVSILNIDCPEWFKQGNSRRRGGVSRRIPSEGRPVLARERGGRRLLLDFLSQRFDPDRWF